MELEHTFKAYQKILVDSGVTKFYPKIRGFIPTYRKVIKSVSNIPNRTPYRNFGIPITTGHDEDSYMLNWAIPDLLSQIKQMNLKPKKVSLNDPLIWSDPKLLNTDWLSHVISRKKEEEPILLAYCFAIGKLIVIDGNHRYHAAKAKSMSEISAHILGANLHTKFLLTDKQKVYFQIHHNLKSLEFFARNPKSYPLHIGNGLEPNTLFLFQEQEFKLTKFKNTAFCLFKDINIF